MLKLHTIRSLFITLVVMLSLGDSFSLYGQNHTTKNITGNWEDINSWQTGTQSPALDGNLSSLDPYSIYGNITRTGDITQGVPLTVYGNLTVTGKYTANGGSPITLASGSSLTVSEFYNNLDLVLESGATLHVTGKFTANGGSVTVKDGAKIIVDGEWYNNTPMTIQSSGSIEVKGKFTGNGGNISLTNGSSLTVDNDLYGNIAINVQSNSSLTVTGTYTGNGGSLLLDNSKATIGTINSQNAISVSSGSRLLVNNDYTATGGKLDINGDVVVLGDYSMNSTTQLQNSAGNFLVGGNFAFNGGSFSYPGSSADLNQMLYILGNNGNPTVTVPNGNTQIIDGSTNYYGNLADLKANDYALWALYSTLVSPECPNSEVSYNVTANSTYNGGTADHAGDQFVWTVTGGVIETISNGTDNVVTVGSTSGSITLGTNPSTTTVTAKVLWTDTGLNTITVQQIASTGCDGNVSSMNVSVGDHEAPVPDVSSLPDVTAECEVTSLTAPTATDNCTAAGSIVVTNDASLPITTQGTTIVTWTYDDGHGNTSTQKQNVIIKDDQAPVPDVATLPDLTGECSATISTPPTATDNCAGTITGTTTDPLTYSTQGTYTVTWTYADGHGNTTTETQNVVIDDVTAPVPDVATLPDVTAECEVTSLTAPTATDNCAGSITGTPDVTLPITAQGTTVVTWTYDDGHGNTSTQKQNVIIKDDQAPVPDVATLPDVTGECSATISTPPTATDNCAGTITGTTTDPLTYSTQGTYTVTWTYADGNGNTTTQTQNVIIKDDQAPIPDVATLPDVTGECSATISTPPTATDNCAGIITGTTTDPLTYSTQGTYTVTWTYADGHGNTTTQTQNVIIDDVTPPVFSSMPTDITKDMDTGVCGAVISWTAPTATDNCDNNVTITRTDGTGINSGDLVPAGTYTISYKATDASGNSTTGAFNITVNPDDQPPTFNIPATGGLDWSPCADDITQAQWDQANDDITPTPPQYATFYQGDTYLDLQLAWLSDNCTAADQLVISWSIQFADNTTKSGTGQLSAHSGNIQFLVGDNIITYTITDQSNNQASYNYDVVVKPRPVITKTTN